MANGTRAGLAEPGHWANVLGSMRVRIVITVTLLLALSAGVSIALLRNVLRDRLDEEIRVALTREAQEFENVAETTAAGETEGELATDFFKSVFDTYFIREEPDEGETLFAFVDGELYHSEPTATDALLENLDDAIEFWLALDRRSDGTIDTPAGTARYVALPLQQDGHKAMFVAANFPALERSEIDDAVRTSVVTQFVMIVAASLLGLALAGRVLRPLRSLANTAQTISATDLTQRIPVRGSDEASTIAQAFNDMLERIERSFATQRQFLDDASHELRSPMTVIRGHVELLDLEDDPEERQAIVRVITDEIDRMNRIVEDLLLLARSERPGFLTMTPISVEELVDDVHRRASVLCSRTWLVGPSPAVTVTADRQLVTQALLQFAQNVCQHTPDGTTATVGASVEGATVSLWVADDGPGVPPEQTGRVFQRFVKGSDSGDGSGLGLSIVAAIADAHGGTARVTTAARGGARFEIVLPLRTSAAAPVSETVRV